MDTTLSPQSSRLTRGYTIALIGTVIWSTTGVFIRYLTDGRAVPPLVLSFWRDLFVFLGIGIVFVVVNPLRLRPGKGQLSYLVLYGFVLSVFNTLYTFSVALNGAAVATVLAYSSAAFTALLAWRFMGESLSRVKVTAILFSLVGCAFVSGALDISVWNLNPLGILTGVLSGVAFAGYSLLGKESSNRSIYPWTAMLYSFGFAAVFLLSYNYLAALLTSQPATIALGSSALTWGVIILLSLGPTVGGYGLYTVSLTYLPASVANLIATLEPAMTAVLAYLLLGEKLNPPQLFGSALIILGVVLLRISEGVVRDARPDIGD
jgi:drug/metabolite transporter (DMT)-like permease